MKCEVTITRVFDAPRPLVFRMWTDPRHLARWWGPSGFSNPVCELDVRPGGRIWIIMRAPDGAEHPMSGTFHEIVEPERIVFMAVAEDNHGKRFLESLTRVTFEEQGQKTRLTVQASAVGLDPVAARMLAGMQAGWSQSIDRLQALVAES
jgi:uncharacterized protein YndB with AHSA1/START domain